MFVSKSRRAEIRFIRSAVDASLRLSRDDNECQYLREHFLCDLPIMRSILTADSIASEVRGQQPARALDWGCGYGDIAYLLKNRRPNAHIVCYDVHDKPSWQVLMERTGLEYVRALDPVALPFDDCSFDYVWAVGVVEHVPDQEGSLRELDRVLRPLGKLFILLAPNRYSYTEFAMRKLGKPAHKRTYSRSELRRVVESHGFHVRSARYEYLMPIMLTSLPALVRRWYSYFGNLVLMLNSAAAMVPGVNCICSNLAILAVKPDER